MANSEQYAQWIVANQDKKGSPDFDKVAAAYKESKLSQENRPISQEPKQDGMFDNLSYKNIPQNLGNLAAGAVRGAGSIGATILAPADMINQKLRGEDFFSMKDNNQRRADMDSGLQSMGADPNSGLYKIGKIGTEIAGTSNMGGVLANGLSKVAPSISASAPALIEGLKTGGMSVNGLKGVEGAALRGLTGGISGASQAGLVDPEQAKSGAIIGAIAPNVIKGAADIGQYVGNNASKKYAEALTKYNRNEPMRDTLKQSIDAGYVVPPNMVNPSFKNATIESFSGKQATSQLASVRNQDVTEGLVRQSLGLADDAPLNKSALEQMRKIEGGAYKQIADLSPEAMINLESLKQARNDSQGWFNAYNRSASPEDLAKAKNYRAVAEQFETNLEKNASDAGQDQLIPALRAARKQIAKTYTVERALNDATGTVNAKVIGRLYDKGNPLSDGLDKVGKFASGFPSVNQASQQMGSPAAHNLRSMASLLMGGAGGAAIGPAGLAAAAAPYVAGSASRGLMFRDGAQKALANQSAPQMAKAAKLAELLRNPEIQQMLAKSAPVAISSSQ